MNPLNGFVPVGAVVAFLPAYILGDLGMLDDEAGEDGFDISTLTADQVQKIHQNLWDRGFVFCEGGSVKAYIQRHSISAGIERPKVP